MASYRTGKDSLAARRKGPLPKANIEWSKVPASACIEDRTTYYVAKVPGKAPAVVFWGSRDARQAQAALRARAQRSCGGLSGAKRRRR